MNAVISQETIKGVQRKGEVRLHIIPALTILVLLYTLVMSLTWLREQASVSLVTRPYAVASANDDSAAANQVLSIVRGWVTTASDSAQAMIDSTPAQTIKDTVASVIEDFRGLMTVEDQVTRPSQQDSLWIRYLPMDDASNLLAAREAQANAVAISE